MGEQAMTGQAMTGQGRFRLTLWPHSLTGQICATVALALLVAQLFNAALLYRGQRAQSELQLVNALGVRIVTTTERLAEARARQEARQEARRGLGTDARSQRRRFDRAPDAARPARGAFETRLRRRAMRRGIVLEETSPDTGDMRPQLALRDRLGQLLDGYDVIYSDLAVYFDDRRMVARPGAVAPPGGGTTGRFMAVLQRPDGQWLSVRVPAPEDNRRITGWLIVQTILLYLVLLGAIIWVTRRITKPLAALTSGVRNFAETQRHDPVEPSGPDDIAGLTQAFNRMSSRIGAMLDEKDVMLGAIGHDLKTPLAALRVRVESVQDETLRRRMVASIDDLNRSLEDMLALARIGHDVQPPQPVNVAALLDTIADEFADLGKDVTLVDINRLVAPVHLTWMRRAVRNLVSNAVRYGQRARLFLTLEQGHAVVRIDDDGPGIAEEELTHIFDAFYRLEQSRSSATGGTGLGLTLARAIAEQHNGQLTLQNRTDDDGAVIGLSARLRFPVK